ncbi:ARPP-1 family domain-containing protein [uncultured Methanobrevibacter sp.]|uniref:ARPP-1 family domain-containing protein n=1 Tax=uncultured Methanobrevibacter sp. TaxID=253161 RepID=UPI0025F70296|nr:DUF6569 family protein [uncultured Methanobrevibacter sp.]
MEIKIDENIISFNELKVQSYKGLTIIPLETEISNATDFLTLKKGFDLGLVEVKECEVEDVNNVIITNNAVTPLILIDGEEIIGAKQNRIVNRTVIVPPKTTMKISVSCTERGRWSYKNNHFCDFEQSDYIANSNTRRAKASALDEQSIQDNVWYSIDNFSHRCSIQPKTSAMVDCYEDFSQYQDEYLDYFKLSNNQTGLIAIIDNEIIGVEIFTNPEIYENYHDKIIRSYIIDSIDFKANDSVDDDKINEIIENISKSEFIKEKSQGLGEFIKFSNNYGTGTALIYDDEIIHMPYFKDL